MQENENKNIGVIKKIGNNTYEILPFPAIPGLALLFKTLDTIGHSFASFGEMAENIKDLINKDGSINRDAPFNGRAMGKAIHTICAAIYANDPKLNTIIEIMSNTLQNGVLINSKNINDLFANNRSELMQVLMVTFKVQFWSFFDGVVSGYHAFLETETQ